MLAAAPVHLVAQAHDPSERLRQVLPADVADHVLAVIAAARSDGLPAAALESRALKFAARGIPPRDIERSVRDHADRMRHVRDTLERARGRRPGTDEVEAGAEAMRQGVDGKQVSALAKSAPSGRSLAVPLFVIGSLVERGLPSDSALARVLARLTARASDRDLEGMAAVARAPGSGQVTGTANRPANPGSPGATPTRPPAATPPTTVPSPRVPTTVPANPGKTTRPTPPPPTTTPPTKRP